MAELRVELATAYASQVMRLLVQLGARVRAPQSYEGHTTIHGRIPVAGVHELQASLPGLTGGEGLLETEPGGYEPVLGEPPVRRRRRGENSQRPGAVEVAIAHDRVGSNASEARVLSG